MRKPGRQLVFNPTLQLNAMADVSRRQVQIWRLELRTRGCVALRGLFTPVFLAAVREYYRRLEEEGYVLRGNRRRAGAPQLHDEPLLCSLGGQLTYVVRQVTGERAPWTFSFLRVYEPGAVLASHRDAPVCRWNIDLVVGGEPAPERRSAWPLWVDGRGGVRPIRLGLGDGLLYRGADLRHWRRAQPASHTTVLAALHYGGGVYDYAEASSTTLYDAHRGKEREMAAKKTVKPKSKSTSRVKDLSVRNASAVKGGILRRRLVDATKKPPTKW